MDDQIIFRNAAEFEDSDIEIVNKIFFENAPIKEFKSFKDRDQFQYKYLDFYKIFYPNLFWIASDGEKTLGYICGVPDIRKEKKLLRLMPYISIFKELYKVFPAQLHINMAKGARGKGVGSLLLQKFEESLGELDVPGMHIITNPKARNRSFYSKNCFLHEEERSLNDLNFLFMGKKL